MALSLIALAREAEALAYQANAAKLLAPFAPEASAQHLRNLKTIHRQICEMLAAEQKDQAA
ncbi:hypothetical protein [Synechococcus phage Ssp-JY39]|nr:hypothetical protein [Synechococcus phage Yong-M2-251]